MNVVFPIIVDVLPQLAGETDSTVKQKAITCQRKGSEEEKPLLQRRAEERVIDSQHLMEMGFGPEEIQKALQETNNNLHQATSLLAEQSLDNIPLEGRNTCHVDY